MLRARTRGLTSRSIANSPLHSMRHIGYKESTVTHLNATPGVPLLDVERAWCSTVVERNGKRVRVPGVVANRRYLFPDGSNEDLTVVIEPSIKNQDTFTITTIGEKSGAVRIGVLITREARELVEKGVLRTSKFVTYTLTGAAPPAWKPKLTPSAE